MDIKLIFPKTSKNDVVYIKKQEYETYYSTKYKYPYLVIERLSMRTGLPAEGVDKVRREDVLDPFAPEPKINKEYSFNKNDYTLMMSYGLSPGHNAPAGHHYTTPEIWGETFSYANICPQEMVFNSGIWVIIENWCKYVSKLQKTKNFTNLRVFTGSIMDKVDSTLSMGDKNINVNIPTHMFKLVCARSKESENSNKIFITCFMCPNRPIEPTNKENQNIIKWTIPLKPLEELSGINFTPLLEKFYGYEKGKTELVNLNDLVPIKFDLSPIFVKQMIKSLCYGLLIYVKNVKQLEKNWMNCKKMLVDENVEYHEEFYNLVKKRLTFGSKKITNNDEIELNESSNKLSFVDDTDLNTSTNSTNSTNSTLLVNERGLYGNGNIKKGGNIKTNNTKIYNLLNKKHKSNTKKSKKHKY